MRAPLALGTISARVIISYIFDWVVLLILGLMSYGFNKLTPVYHPFSLVDLSISYPYTEELVTTTYLALAAILGPGLIIFFVSVVLIPGPRRSTKIPVSQLLRRKLWEWNTGWLGLALSIITALLLTTGMKSIFGKPRPDMLARCNPDPTTVEQYRVGGYGGGISDAWVLVDQRICRQPDKGILDDGFRSFPSGHSSTSWAGLLYLSLYLCSKFAVVFPHLSELSRKKEDNDHPQLTRSASPIKRDDSTTPFGGRRGEAAAPPLYLLFLLYIPIGVAIFISASRYYDYRHHGFDVISGSLLGALSAWFSFRLYHLPMTRGAGWSWGPRSPRRAFGVSVGSQGYVSREHREASRPMQDVEMGGMQHHQYKTSTFSENQGLVSDANSSKRERSASRNGLHNGLQNGTMP